MSDFKAYEDQIRRHSNGAIDIDCYERLARRARAEATAEVFAIISRWGRSVGATKPSTGATASA